MIKMSIFISHLSFSEEVCDTHKNGNTSSEIILDDEEVNEDDEDVGPLARHRRLER